jgi:hypothetical protein
LRGLASPLPSPADAGGFLAWRSLIGTDASKSPEIVHHPDIDTATEATVALIHQSTQHYDNDTSSRHAPSKAVHVRRCCMLHVHHLVFCSSGSDFGSRSGRGSGLWFWLRHWVKTRSYVACPLLISEHSLAAVNCARAPIVVQRKRSLPHRHRRGCHRLDHEHRPPVPYRTPLGGPVLKHPGRLDHPKKEPQERLRAGPLQCLKHERSGVVS